MPQRPLGNIKRPNNTCVTGVPQCQGKKKKKQGKKIIQRNNGPKLCKCGKRQKVTNSRSSMSTEKD